MSDGRLYLGDNCIQIFHLGRQVYRRTYGRKFSFTATRKRSRNVISNRISDVIPPKTKNLNMVIPILMHY